MDNAGHELPVHRIPNIGNAVEFYFSPDGNSLIGTAKREGDDAYHVYTLKIDGTDIRRINDRGDDACSFFFPDGKRIVWTSTRDHPELPNGNYSVPADYPKGAELYTSNLDGSDVRRLTDNKFYDAEVSVSPDGQQVLFGRQTDGKMDLWRMRPDGADEFQITHFEGWEPGGAFYLPDSRTIIFRAWKTIDQAKMGGRPMSIFTVKDDGTDLRRVTDDDATNWSPYPAPDGRHFVFAKLLPPRNFEIYLGDLDSSEQVRLTYNDAFDGFPVISPDGRSLLFTSSRDAKPGERAFTLFLMDISSLNLGKPGDDRTAEALAQTEGAPSPPRIGGSVMDNPGHELPVHRIPNIGNAVEFYFSPDGKRIIGDARREGDTAYHVHTLNIDGTDIRRINDRGKDACSYYFPDGKRIVWTSTRDHPELPIGNFSDPADYPQGAELYTSNPDGSDVRRLTTNNVYEAEVSVSPDGQWVLFGRQTNGKMDLWRMRPDGTGEMQITHFDGWEPGGAFYLPDNRTIIFRAWRTIDQARKDGLPMSIFTIRDDGTNLRRVTNDDGTNWSPYPAPDGRHFVFVKKLPPNNFEIYLGDLDSSEQVRLTYNDAFDGYPVISPDGRSLLFSSNRDAKPGERAFTLYLMDISSLNLGKRADGAAR